MHRTPPSARVGRRDVVPSISDRGPEGIPRISSRPFSGDTLSGATPLQLAKNAPGGRSRLDLIRLLLIVDIDLDSCNLRRQA